MPASGAESAAPAAGPEWFRTTHWSVVCLAGQNNVPGAREALETLCRNYWYPLYAYTRRRGHGPEEAQDLTQEFFARLLERNDLARADREKGRFRSFLLGALNHYLAYEWRKSQAAKRGGGQAVVSLDEQTAEERYRQEAVSDLTPEKVYERRWAWTLFDRALSRLQAEYGAADKARVFEELKRFLSDQAGEGEYAVVGRQLEMTSGAVAVAVNRLRQRYRELVREEIAHTVTSPSELDEELRHLVAVLSG